jgi:hypothetical protein
MASPALGPSSREVIVKVGLEGDQIVVDPEYFQISKSKNEEVRWICTREHQHDAGEPCFNVDFEKDGSPFYESQFSSDAPVSGLARRNVLPGPRIYSYTVRIGSKTLDPGGGVKQ